ncbi:MAG TPA: hypothetical protein VKU82_06400, partial [Planctomycetaceae bacterium]|nr:hypothetical protein [Planctomycetaceae bacterium]
CLKTRRFDTTVPACFYDAVHDVASENGDLAGLMNQLGGQDGIRALMNEFEEAPAPPNRSRRAAVNLLAAWHLGWHDDARRRFDSLPEPIDDYLFNLWQVDREFLRYDLGNPLNSAGALRAMQRAATLIQSERPIGSFAVSADGTSVAFGSAQIEQPLTLWNASTGKLHSLDVVNNNLSISLLRVSHDSKKLAALQQTAPPTTGQETSWSSTITVWTLPESAGRIVLEPGRESVWSLCWLPDGRHLALGLASGRAAILSVETGHMQAATPPAGSMALSVAAASQGRALAVGLANGAIKMYELPAAADLAVAKRPLLLKHSGGFEKHIKGVEAVQFSADGKTLASSSQGDRSVWLWDVKSRAALHRLEGRHAVFAPNGRKLATAGGAALRRQAALWDVRTGRADKRMACPGDSELIDVAFTPDSKFLLASTADGTVYAWQADDGD